MSFADVFVKVLDSRIKRFNRKKRLRMLTIPNLNVTMKFSLFGIWICSMAKHIKGIFLIICNQERINV